jgi:hypothetical protein
MYPILQTTIRKSVWRRRVIGAMAVLAFALTMVAPASAQDSKGSDFWLGFPGNLSHGDLRLFVAGDTATAGTVAIPGLAFSQPFTVTPGSVTTVDIPDAAQMQLSNTVQDFGIHVTAAAEITVYGLNRASATTDAYLGLPTDALGTEYINLGYKNVNVVNGNQFGIVASQNATTVTITPTASTPGHPAGTAYTVNLNQGQTYLLRDTNAAPSDLSGSIISADKPIAVYGGHHCANLPPGHFACDHIVEQLTATTQWGQSFLSMPLATRLNGDTFRVLASENGTTVQINGSTVATLNRAQLHEQIIAGPARITADKPVLVMQYSNGETFDDDTDANGDPFQMMIPPFEQYLAGYTVSTPAEGFDPNFINIVAPNSAVGSVQVDGTAVPPGSFTPIPGSSFSGAQHPVTVGSHTVTSPQPLGVHSYGFGFFDSYGYPGGLSLSEVARVENISLTPETATNPVGTEHCVDALVTDQNGSPLQDIRVDFAVSGAHTTSGFDFTDAAGKARFCYTGANVGDDTITASVGTLSDTAAKRWVANAPVDTTKPACALDRTGTDAQGRKFLEVKTQDTGSGLASIVVTKSTNANTVVPAFTPGTTDPVIVRGTKIIQTQSSVVELRVTDVAGNVTVCDPVMTVVIRAAGKPETQRFTDIPRAEHLITVYNGDPGIQQLNVEVNGESFRALRLAHGDERQLDVAAAMRDGDNTVTLTSTGRPGGEALVLISD